jgi:two-component system chemotaxis response regulator CheY
VVLVEPSRAQSAIIRKYLQSQGISSVVAVVSGAEALQAVRLDRPDAIISALHLSDMTGVQLAKQVREACQPAPGFVLISSEAESVDAGTLSQCGRAVLLQKPFTAERLVETLKMAAGEPAPSPSRVARGRLRVLIVDDSAAARAHIRSVLEGLGLTEMTEAEDGAHAVALVARDAFQLIITDYNMPLMDGRGLIAFLKQSPATASIPIIMVTTEQDPAKLSAVRQLGVTICEKSFPPDVVRKILDELMGSS